MRRLLSRRKCQCHVVLKLILRALYLRQSIKYILKGNAIERRQSIKRNIQNSNALHYNANCRRKAGYPAVSQPTHGQRSKSQTNWAWSARIVIRIIIFCYGASGIPFLLQKETPNRTETINPCDCWGIFVYCNCILQKFSPPIQTRG